MHAGAVVYTVGYTRARLASAAALRSARTSAAATAAEARAAYGAAASAALAAYESVAGAEYVRSRVALAGAGAADASQGASPQKLAAVFQNTTLFPPARRAAVAPPRGKLARGPGGREEAWGSAGDVGEANKVWIDWHGTVPVERDPARAARERYLPRVAALPPRADGRPRTMGPGLSTDDAKCPLRQNKPKMRTWVAKLDYLPELGVAFLHVPKCGSSSLRRLLSHTFGGYVMINVHKLPRDVFTVAILRDPVERFLSGYEEGVFRALRYGNTSHSFKEVQKSAPFIAERVGPYKHSGAFWDDAEVAEDTFNEYIRDKYDPLVPMDIHGTLMSYLVAAEADKVDFVGYVNTIDDDWTTILKILGIENMHGDDNVAPLGSGTPTEESGLRPAACADPTGAKCVTYKRDKPHLAAANLTGTQRARVCELVRQDLECLELRSEWC